MWVSLTSEDISNSIIKELEANINEWLWKGKFTNHPNIVVRARPDLLTTQVYTLKDYLHIVERNNATPVPEIVNMYNEPKLVQLYSESNLEVKLKIYTGMYRIYFDSAVKTEMLILVNSPLYGGKSVLRKEPYLSRDLLKAPHNELIQRVKDTHW